MNRSIANDKLSEQMLINIIKLMFIYNNNILKEDLAISIDELLQQGDFFYIVCTDRKIEITEELYKTLKLCTPQEQL
jgi:hypothetical protein